MKNTWVAILQSMPMTDFVITFKFIECKLVTSQAYKKHVVLETI